ncbi:MAG TPA: hypothetical protein PKD64_12835 [Pirellulaceae bacterium]|nr:hypothetical protein [Pirellulaceae bacterium]HMO93073.1 hypothetical protein [Pirellulaceae bacterium]HMP69976.1 hypothetical protein [Pirellulaceae bacterium]
MSSTSRSRLLIEQSQFALGDQKVSLTVIDLFDGRPPNLPPLKLIETHRILCKTGATVKLVPGEENSTLPRIANSLQNTDLVLISSSSDLRNQVQLWFYLPRMLGERGQVLQQVTLENGRKQWRELTGKQILSLNQTAQDSKLRSVA